MTDEEKRAVVSLVTMSAPKGGVHSPTTPHPRPPTRMHSFFRDVRATANNIMLKNQKTFYKSVLNGLHGKRLSVQASRALRDRFEEEQRTLWGVYMKLEERLAYPYIYSD